MMENNPYANKIVNPDFYEVIKIDGPEPKYLTEEEWKNGEQGLVFFDSKTNKIVFHGKDKKLLKEEKLLKEDAIYRILWDGVMGYFSC